MNQARQLYVPTAAVANLLSLSRFKETTISIADRSMTQQYEDLLVEGHLAAVNPSKVKLESTEVRRMEVEIAQSDMIQAAYDGDGDLPGRRIKRRRAAGPTRRGQAPTGSGDTGLIDLESAATVARSDPPAARQAKANPRSDRAIAPPPEG